MKTMVISVFILLQSLFSMAFAEGACPPGQHQTTPIGPGPIGCAPIPSSTSRPAVKWLSRWGAFASDGAGTWGVASDQESKKDASSIALDDCRQRRGKKCEIRFQYHNQCAAISTSSSYLNMASSDSEKSAIALATKKCASKSSDECRTYYSGCSLPVKAN